MSTDFVFKEITKEDLNSFIETAYIFNRDRDFIERDKVTLNSFSDETLGDSVEKLDVAVKKGEEDWRLLDIEDKIESYNEIPLGYILKDVEYDKVLIIIRRMSNLIYDKTDSSSNSYIYSIVRDEYLDVMNHPEVSGLLAFYRVSLDKDIKELSEDIDNRFSSTDVDKIMSGIKTIIKEC